jgi:hypothetical protein
MDSNRISTPSSRCIPRHDGVMGIRMRDLLDDALGSLRYEACEKRLRLYLDGELVADTINGLLV